MLLDTRIATFEKSFHGDIVAGVLVALVGAMSVVTAVLLYMPLR
jgi:hypothetical protein